MPLSSVFTQHAEICNELSTFVVHFIVLSPSNVQIQSIVELSEGLFENAEGIIYNTTGSRKLAVDESLLNRTSAIEKVTVGSDKPWKDWISSVPY